MEKTKDSARDLLTLVTKLIKKLEKKSEKIEKQPPEMFYKKCVLKNLTKLI